MLRTSDSGVTETFGIRRPSTKCRPRNFVAQTGQAMACFAAAAAAACRRRAIQSTSKPAHGDDKQATFHTKAGNVGLVVRAVSFFESDYFVLENGGVRKLPLPPRYLICAFC